MTKLLTGTMMLLALGYGAMAQERTAGNAAGDFSATSASQVNLLSTDTTAHDFALSNAEANAPGVPAAEAAPAPAAKPKYIFGDRDDYRWQLGVGFEYMRFRSGPIDTSLIGLNSTLSYFTNSWFAVEIGRAHV